MKKIIKYHFYVFLFALSVCSSFAQTPQKIEQELLGHIEQIKKHSTYGPDYQEAKLIEENESFKEKLLKYVKIPATLKYGFDKLSEYIQIETSPDGNFRIYSWDTENGGSLHFFETVYQFRVGNNEVYSKELILQEGDGGSFIIEINQLKTKAGNVYLATSGAKLMSALYYQSINLFKIEGGKLNDQIKLFKTASGLTNQIGFEYDMTTTIKNSVLSFDLIDFEPKTNIVKIPVVIKRDESDFGTVTDKFIEYKFNGEYFVKIK